MDKNTKLSSQIIYTHSSKGTKAYLGEKITINGFISGKNIGTIATISESGELNLDIPEFIPDDKLDSRPGTETKGGPLSTIPEIKLWKNDEDFIILVYVNTDFGEELGDYKKGWNYANNKHEKVESIEGYKWIIIDEELDGGKENE